MQIPIQFMNKARLYEELAKELLLEVFPYAQIKAMPTSVTDYIVEMSSDGLAFAVEVKHGHITEDIQKDYQQRLKTAFTEIGPAKIPCVLMVVDVKTKSAKVAMAITWNFQRATIEQEYKWVALKSENASLIHDMISSSDNVIRMLTDSGCNFMKTISFSYTKDNRICNFKAIYFRSLAYNYKLHSKPALTEKERFDRLANGRPEDEYPDDELDKVIYNAIKSQYPDAKKRTSMLLFNTELRDFTRYVANNPVRQAEMSLYLSPNPFLKLDVVSECPFKDEWPQMTFSAPVERLTNEIMRSLGTYKTIDKVTIVEYNKSS